MIIAAFLILFLLLAVKALAIPSQGWSSTFLCERYSVYAWNSGYVMIGKIYSRDGDTAWYNAVAFDMDGKGTLHTNLIKLWCRFVIWVNRY